MAWALSSDRPIYTQLVEQLTLSVLTGRFPPGGRLPSVRDLAAEAGVNPNTMQRALSGLEESGLIATQRTAGRTVTEDAALIERCRAELARAGTREWRAAMVRLGYGPEALPDLLARELKEGNEEHGDL